MTLIFNPLGAVIMTYLHAKDQGRSLVGSQDRVNTNGRTDAIALPDSLMRSVLWVTSLQSSQSGDTILSVDDAIVWNAAPQSHAVTSR